VTCLSRRALLASAAGGLTALAGCSYQARGDTAPGETATTAAGGGDRTDAFVSALKSRGIVVDSTLRMGSTLSLMYIYRPDHDRQDRVRLATTYAEYAGVSKPLLAVTVLEPDAEARHGGFDIKHSWAQGYAAGDLSRDEYLSRINDTYSQR